MRTVLGIILCTLGLMFLTGATFHYKELWNAPIVITTAPPPPSILDYNELYIEGMSGNDIQVANKYHSVWVINLCVPHPAFNGKDRIHLQLYSEVEDNGCHKIYNVIRLPYQD